MESTAPVYKLTYFNFRSRAEPIRLIFAYVGVPYEDIRIQREDWSKVKPNYSHKLEWHQLPILEFSGQVLSQSITITRFLARRFNLVGVDEFEAAKCDEYVDAMMDTRVEWKRRQVETDPVKREEMRLALLRIHFPPYLNKFEEISTQAQKNGRKFLVGNQVTWADFLIAHTLEFYEDTVDKDLLSNYPNLRLHRQHVYGIPQISEWIERRPKTSR